MCKSVKSVTQIPDPNQERLRQRDAEMEMKLGAMQRLAEAPHAREARAANYLSEADRDAEACRQESANLESIFVDAQAAASKAVGVTKQAAEQFVKAVRERDAAEQRRREGGGDAGHDATRLVGL